MIHPNRTIRIYQPPLSFNIEQWVLTCYGCHGQWRCDSHHQPGGLLLEWVHACIKFWMSEYGHRADGLVCNKSILQVDKLQIWLLHSFVKSLFHSRPWFNIQMSSYQYRKSHCGGKTIWQLSYLHNGISYTGKMISLYWITDLDKWHSI